MGSQTPSDARRAVADLTAFCETKAEAPEIKRARTAANLAMVTTIYIFKSKCQDKVCVSNRMDHSLQCGSGSCRLLRDVLGTKICLNQEPWCSVTCCQGGRIERLHHSPIRINLIRQLKMATSK
eukprot:scaffold3882_cov164-Amphora_coffeaeformis.AAC.7